MFLHGNHNRGGGPHDNQVPFLTDISLSSSQGMSSFLQDFDLHEGGGESNIDNFHQAPQKMEMINYRTYH